MALTGLRAWKIGLIAELLGCPGPVDALTGQLVLWAEVS